MIVYYKDKSLPNRFKECRMEAGLSQKQVALSLGFVGNRYTISCYEHNKRLPNIATLIKMKNLYKVSLDYLLCLDDYKSHQDYLLQELGIDQELEELLLITKTIPKSSNLINQFIQKNRKEKIIW